MGSETTNSDKRCAEQITMSWMETVSYLILALCFSAVPWAPRRAGWVLLAAGLGTSVVAIAAGIVAEARLYPLTDLLVAALAVCGGVLLGRLVSGSVLAPGGIDGGPGGARLCPGAGGLLC